MSELKHHWLVAGNVIASVDNQVGQRGLNTLIVTDTPVFTRADIATAQEGLMRRFLGESTNPEAAKISDVFVISVSNLGLMSQEEFNGPFNQGDAAPAAANTR